MFNGATRNPIEDSIHVKTLGYETVKMIKKDKIQTEMCMEIREGSKLIVPEYRNSDGLITNILGKVQPRKKGNRKNNIGAELSHILAGDEVKIMEIVNKSIGENMHVLIHDG